MAANCRFAFAVHVLAALAWRARRGFECGITSEDLAGSVNTNPVVIRRLLGPLRAAGLIETVKGCGGGSKGCDAACCGAATAVGATTIGCAATNRGGAANDFDIGDAACGCHARLLELLGEKEERPLGRQPRPLEPGKPDRA